MRRVVSLAVALALTGITAEPASADETIRATFSTRFANPNVTIDQGEPLYFMNGDAVRHDVTATQDGTDGRPLFATPLVSQNQTAFVEGSQYLTTGGYPFICTIHPSMKGSVTVTTAGTPVPRPGGGTDRTPPTVSASIRTSVKRSARRTGRIAARLGSDEDATASARVSARGHTIASRRLSLDAGERVNRGLRLTRVGRRVLARRGRIAVTLTVTARDAAGNRTVKRVRKTLR